jgi:hypothetical protein
MRLRILFCFFMVLNAAFSQQDTLSLRRHYHHLHFYSYGLQAYFDEDMSCIGKAQDAFGFDYKIKAGCVVRRTQVRRYQAHNKKTEAKLKARHGENWRERYNEMVAGCYQVKE